jgi:hypothetical protein
MAPTRFEGTGPVARYWLAHCEGFAVKGGTRGVVEELIHDADPHVTTRLVVRTGGHRRKIVPANAVAAVVPAAKLLVVDRPRRRRRRRLRVRLPTLPPLTPGVRRAAAFALPSFRALGADFSGSIRLLRRR